MKQLTEELDAMSSKLAQDGGIRRSQTCGHMGNKLLATEAVTNAAAEKNKRS